MVALNHFINVKTERDRNVLLQKAVSIYRYIVHRSRNPAGRERGGGQRGLAFLGKDRHYVAILNCLGKDRHNVAILNWGRHLFVGLASLSLSFCFRCIMYHSIEKKECQYGFFK